MNTRPFSGPLALLLLLTACGEQSGGPSKGEDVDGGISQGDADAKVEAPNENDASNWQQDCSASSHCETPNPCLVAECKSGKCEFSARPDGFACDDQDACSQTDQCVGGECAGSDRIECSAKNACHEVGTCDPASGMCSTPMRLDGAECSAAGLCEAGECWEPVVVLAKQDFELTPATPTWTFTGSPTYREGHSAANAGPPESPIGIGGSRAWETTTVGDGSTIELANVTIPQGFDSARLRFRLAAMDLTGTGGPDALDWVLVSLSVDGGARFYDRLRIRGAVDNDSYWGYDATGVASAAHAPESEVTFQPTASGLQTTLGYSTVEILFDSSVTQVQVRLTARSSSSSDTWLIDDVELLAERARSSP